MEARHRSEPTGKRSRAPSSLPGGRGRAKNEPLNIPGFHRTSPDIQRGVFGPSSSSGGLDSDFKLDDREVSRVVPPSDRCARHLSRRPPKGIDGRKPSPRRRGADPRPAETMAVMSSQAIKTACHRDRDVQSGLTNVEVCPKHRCRTVQRALTRRTMNVGADRRITPEKLERPHMVVHWCRMTPAYD